MNRYKKLSEIFNQLKKNFLWFVIGSLTFFPIEIYSKGFFLSYLISLLIFIFTGITSFTRLFLFALYVFLVIISSIFNGSDSLTYIVNPVFIVFILSLGNLPSKSLQPLKYGIYFSSLLQVLILLKIAYSKGIDSLFELITKREWALDQIPYFGNGLAMMFCIAMLLAFYDKKIMLFLIFFIGGILTTSRIPILLFVCVYSIWFFYSIKKNNNWFLLIISLMTFSFCYFYFDFFDITTGQIEQISGRMSHTNDRLNIYKAAFNTFLESPVFGVGNHKLPFYEHAHNSYLQVLFKTGILSFIPWALLVYLSLIRNISFRNNFGYLFLLILVSTFQIGLHNPSVLIGFLICRTLIREINCDRNQ